MDYEQNHEDHGRKRSSRICFLCIYGGSGHLSNHTFISNGGACGRVGGPWKEKYIWDIGQAGGNAVRGGGNLSRARCAGCRCSGILLHGFPGTDADDSHHVPYRGAAETGCGPCGKQECGYQRNLHFCGALRRYGLPSHGICHDGKLHGTGSHGLGGGVPSGSD